MSELIGKILAEYELDEANDDLGVYRHVLQNVQLNSQLVLAIQGVRRCGKSILMKQIIEKENLRAKAIYINFEDPRFSEILNPTLLDQIVAYHEQSKQDAYFYFLDEIQNVDQWEKWLHIQLAKRKKKRTFIVSGSNSKLLSGKLGSALTGRHITLELFPFSFSEFQQFTHLKLADYLNQGGFPLALSYEKPQALLRDYFSDIIERDVKTHVAARSTQALTRLAKCVYESTGSELSLRNLAKTFDTSIDTIHTYMDAFEASYLTLPCPYFTYSERKSLVRPKKYYPVDLGLRNSLVTRSGADLGKKIETAVFHVLRKMHQNIYYWRGVGEVDFVVETPEGILPIQVTANETKDRHKKALDEFKKAHPQALKPIIIDQQNLEEFLSTGLLIRSRITANF